MNYREQSALFQIDYKDEEDLLLEKLEFYDDDLESNSITSSGQKIGPRDTLIKENVTWLESGVGNGRFRVEIRETIKFRPPRKLADSMKKSNNINTIQPNCNNPKTDLLEQN